MRLAEIQRLLIDGIHPHRTPAARDAAGKLLAESGELSTAERFFIYRNNITAARICALGAIYPVCKEIVGEDCFQGMAKTFAWQAPDRSEDLNVYGEAFAAFLAEQVRIHEAFSELPYLPELARLEWHWHAAYYAPDDVPFDASRLTTLTPDDTERITFPLSASLSLMETGFPVFEIWRRHRENEDVSSVGALVETEYLCVHRAGYEPRVERIDKARYALLRTCREGLCLAQLAERTEVTESLPTLLPEMIARGWIVADKKQGSRGQST